jgi:energy-coupling factor transporter ATP-binding protein EcfA2
MRITRLQLTHFKAHASLTLEPAARLTVIRGPNESGKSSIAQAIEMVLFSRPDADSDPIRHAWSWGASSPPEVALEFEVEGQAGRLLKRFGGARAAAGELTLDGRSSTDVGRIQEQVAQLTGIPGAALFRATASVGHRALDAVGDEPELHERLQQAVSGADRATARAKQKLETAIGRHRSQGRQDAGLLDSAREGVGLLERELAAGEAALARLGADRAAWADAHARREELDVQLRREQAGLAEAQRAEGLAQQRDRAADRHARLQRAAALLEEAQRLQRAMPAAITLPQLRAAVSRASNLQYELSELEAEVSVAAETVSVDEEPELAPPRPMRWLALGAVFVALGWLAAFLLSGAGLLGTAVVAVLAAGVIITLVQAVRGAGRRRQHGLAMQLAQASVVRHAEAERSQHEQLRRTQRELASTLATAGVGDVAAAEALLTSMQEQTESLAHIEGELRGLGIEERNVRRLHEALDEAAVTTEQANRALAATGSLTATGSLAADPAVARAAAERSVAQTLAARDAARSEEDQAQGRIDANQVDAELVAGLAEREAEARERYTELQRRLLVYERTLEAIEAAERATLKTAARYLEERMGPTVAAVTDGRYDDIEVDEQSLAFRLRSPETGELIDVGLLSQGTADQLFLAARLGLVRLVSLDRSPPLILDDPFVTFDTTRAERALRVVKQLATEHGFQVLFLTCSDRFDALADELVVLPGPSGERLLANPTRPLTEPASSPARPPETPVPTLRFEPDPRPNPDPVAPRRAQAAGVASERDSGIADPFGLGRSEGNEAAG